jgi:hypothetical protein
MNRTACAALLLATACASPTATRDEAPGLPPPPVSYGEVLRLGADDQGFRAPRLADEGCLGEALRRAPGLAGVDNKVRFAVMRDGSLARFSYLQPVAEAQRRAIEEAFSSCAWTPGLDPAGHPVAVWVIQPIRVRPPDGAPSR